MSELKDSQGRYIVPRRRKPKAGTAPSGWFEYFRDRVLLPEKANQRDAFIAEYQLIEYQPKADFKYWTQRIFNAIILCLVSCVALIIVCQWVHPFQEALFAFFRWILIPVRPLLIASPSSQFSGLINWLVPLSQGFNFLMIPIVGWLAATAIAEPYYLSLAGGRLSVLQLLTSSATTYDGLPTMGPASYNLQTIDSILLSGDVRILVERPRGKKSSLDYLLNVGNGGKGLRLRFGDIKKAEDRQRLIECLEEAAPEQIDATIFAPFKKIPERQSYTELWLRELSGAPKRERLTPLSEGSTLRNGDYTILRKVGVGGQGTVYLARPALQMASSGDLVVVKEFVLPVYPDIRVRQKAAERFQAEAMMLSRLNHPQIVKFLDLLVEDHRAYLVLEHVEGDTLKAMVGAEGPLPEAQVIDLAFQIASILSYLHSQEPPVNHRDLTPDNIILGEDGLVKLIDFSVAQEISAGITGSVVGKPNYISPEQFRGKPNTQSDIYSLGGTIYYLLIGRDPPPITVLHPKAENDRISDALDAIVSRCTRLEARERYPEAEDLLADLQRLRV